MARIGDQVSWLEGNKRFIGTLLDIGRTMPWAFLRTDDGLLHCVGLKEIEQKVHVEILTARKL